MIERKHGLSTEQVPVSAYVGSSKNLKDLKDPWAEYAHSCGHVQGYLSQQKQPPPRTLQQDYAWGPMVVLGGEGSFS